MSKSLLLLGAHGFAGRHLLEISRAAGLEVVAASRKGGGGALSCDLLDPASVAACVEAARPDLIVNAAGAPSVAASWERPAAAAALNAGGVDNLLGAVFAATPQAHVICISSAAVYGEPEPAQLPLGEQSTLAPVSPYGAAKVEMEAFCERRASAERMRIAVVRAFNLIGPGQPPFHAASGFARRIAEAERDGERAVELSVGNPGAVRDYTDVRDAARAIVELSRRECLGTFNLCSGTGTAVTDLVAGLARWTELDVSTRCDPALGRPADPAALVGDPGRLREATGFEPALPLSRSLADLLAWWRRRLAEA